MHTLVLGRGDETQLEAFLSQRALTSLLMRGIARRGGLDDRGGPYHATYAAAVEGGRIVAVAAHCWNGILLLESPQDTVPAVARAALAASGRPLRAVDGPWPQLCEAARTLGLAPPVAPATPRERIYALDLSVSSDPSHDTDLRAERPGAEHLELLREWRARFLMETLGAADSPALRAAGRRHVERAYAGAHWLVMHGAVPVAYAGAGATFENVVEVAGVWTPREHRGRGYARYAVAAVLAYARARGASHAVLYADPANPAADRAYRAVGFRPLCDHGGDYWLALMHDEIDATPNN